MLVLEWMANGRYTPTFGVGYWDAPLEDAQTESRTGAITHAQHPTLTEALRFYAR